MIKFKYLEVEYDLEELVGKENLFKLPAGNKLGITRNGITELEHKFPKIEVTLGNIQVAEFNGMSVMALHARGVDTSSGKAPTINTLAEVSEDNLNEDGKRFPVATLEYRAKHRCFLEMLNLHGKVYSEDELASVQGLEKKVDTTPKATEKAKKEEANINWLTNPEFIRVTQEIRETCYILKKSDDDRRKIYASHVDLPDTATIDEIMKKINLDIAKRILNELKAKK